MDNDQISEGSAVQVMPSPRVSKSFKEFQSKSNISICNHDDNYPTGHDLESLILELSIKKWFIIKYTEIICHFKEYSSSIFFSNVGLASMTPSKDFKIFKKK